MERLLLNDLTYSERLHPHGSGVGLRMVTGMLANAAGRIEVEGELQRGTIFRVRFLR